MITRVAQVTMNSKSSIIIKLYKNHQNITPDGTLDCTIKIYFTSKFSFGERH